MRISYFFFNFKRCESMIRLPTNMWIKVLIFFKVYKSLFFFCFSDIWESAFFCWIPKYEIPWFDSQQICGSRCWLFLKVYKSLCVFPTYANQPFFEFQNLRIRVFVLSTMSEFMFFVPWNMCKTLKMITFSHRQPKLLPYTFEPIWTYLVLICSPDLPWN